MNRRAIGASAKSEDWFGNNAAITCPRCGKVYIVSGFIGRGERKCPACENSTGVVTGSKDKGGEAYVTWESN